MENLSGKCVLLGVTGGIAAYKMASVASGLRKAGADVHVIMTENAAQFIDAVARMIQRMDEIIAPCGFPSPSAKERE